MAGLAHEKPEKPLCLLIGRPIYHNTNTEAQVWIWPKSTYCAGGLFCCLFVFLSPTGLSPSFSVFSLLSCCNKGLKNPETKKSVEILLKGNSRQDLSDIRSNPKAAA